MHDSSRSAPFEAADAVARTHRRARRWAHVVRLSRGSYPWTLPDDGSGGDAA